MTARIRRSWRALLRWLATCPGMALPLAAVLGWTLAACSSLLVTGATPPAPTSSLPPRVLPLRDAGR